MKKRAQIIDRFDTRCFKPGEIGFRGGRNIGTRCAASRFDIGAVFTRIAYCERIFTALGQYHQFFGTRPADCAAVGFNNPEFQTQTFQNPFVCRFHRVKFTIKIFGGSVKAVPVFHDEFTGTHQSETGTCFVTELGFDLIHVQRELFIAGDPVANDINHHLFVGRSQNKQIFFAVTETE